MDNIGLMSETVNFIQGSKRNYDSSTMQGGVYFSKDSKEIFLNGESYGISTLNYITGGGCIDADSDS